MEDQKEQDTETGFVNRLYRGFESAIILDRPPDDCDCHGHHSCLELRNEVPPSWRFRDCGLGIRA